MYITFRELKRPWADCEACQIQAEYENTLAPYELKIKLANRTIKIWLCSNHLEAFKWQAHCPAKKQYL